MITSCLRSHHMLTASITTISNYFSTHFNLLPVSSGKVSLIFAYSPCDLRESILLGMDAYWQLLGIEGNAPKSISHVGALDRNTGIKSTFHDSQSTKACVLVSSILRRGRVIRDMICESQGMCIHINQRQSHSVQKNDGIWQAIDVYL
jgi:hypothetical protein